MERNQTSLSRAFVRARNELCILLTMTRLNGVKKRVAAPCRIVQGPAPPGTSAPCHSQCRPPQPAVDVGHRLAAADRLSVLWGGSFYFAKIAVLEIPPLTLALGRVAIAAAVRW